MIIEIKDYIENNNIEKKPIIRNTNKDKTKTKFLFCSETKNFIYFSCYKKKFSCHGTAKINKPKKTFIITKYCENEIEHIQLEYEEFVKLLENKNIDSIDFTHKKIQKFFVIHFFLKKRKLI